MMYIVRHCTIPSFANQRPIQYNPSSSTVLIIQLNQYVVLMKGLPMMLFWMDFINNVAVQFFYKHIETVFEKILRNKRLKLSRL